MVDGYSLFSPIPLPKTPLYQFFIRNSTKKAVDPINKSEPQIKKICSFCQKIITVSVCNRKPNLLEESKHRSLLPTPSLYQQFKTRFNK